MSRLGAPVARASSATAVSPAQLASRAGVAFTAWSPGRDQYRDSYVNPDRWTLHRTGCGSWSGGPIELSPPSSSSRSTAGPPAAEMHHALDQLRSKSVLDVSFCLASRRACR
jgi:hypothetical protein